MDSLSLYNMPSSYSPAPLSLTFGVEIECYIRFPDGKYGNSSNFRSIFKNAHRALQATLNRAGVPAHLVEPRDDGLNKDYSTWLIEDDPSLEAYTEDGATETTSAEIISRVLPHGPAGAAEVSTALRALHADHALSAGTDGKAGLHIHVGNGTDSIPFQTAKNLALLTTAFEPVLFALVPPERLNSRYCLPPSRMRVLFLDDCSLAHHLRAISEAASLEELLPFTAGRDGNWQRVVAVNFLPLRTRGGGGGTVEFRLFAGTTDAVEIELYVDLVVGLVEVAHAAEPRRAQALLRRFGDPSFTAVDFVEAIGGLPLRERFAALARRRAGGREGARDGSPSGASDGDAGGSAWSREAVVGPRSGGSPESLGSLRGAPADSRE